MRSTTLSLSSIALCVTLLCSFGCGSKRSGFWQAQALDTYSASPSMTQQYGIVEWHVFVGRKQIVYTGYDAQGKAKRGVQLSWYLAANGMPSHTKLMMLDGTGATVRRMVGGGMTGQLTVDQKNFVETLRYDITRGAMARQSSLSGNAFGGGGLRAQSVGLGGLHTLDAPNSGPDCQSAQQEEIGNNEAIDCALDASAVIVAPEAEGLESLANTGGVVKSCGSWYLDHEHTQSVCDTENLTNCDVNGENCDFSNVGSGSTGTAQPQQQCDAACLCANYPDSAQNCDSVNTSGSCSADGDCTGGQTCQSGSCAPAQGDALSDQNTSIDNGTSTSCSSGGDLSADSSNGDVGCSNGSNDNGSGSGSSGSSGSGGSTDNGGDPNSGGGGTNDYCAGDGNSCGSASDCCSGSCVANVCGGSCLNDGDSCVSDSDCCTGSCSGGICGSGGGTNGCANDGDSCSQDSDCCNGTCSNGTCGSGGGGTCGNPGDSCGSDADCCSSSCDPDYYFCN